MSKINKSINPQKTVYGCMLIYAKCTFNCTFDTEVDLISDILRLLHKKCSVCLIFTFTQLRLLITFSTLQVEDFWTFMSLFTVGRLWTPNISNANIYLSEG